MKVYVVNVTVKGHAMVECPTCHPGWQRSGCYEIEAPGERDVVCIVRAESEENARELVTREDDFSCGEDFNTDDIIISSVSLLEDEEDRDAGIVEMDYEAIKWYDYEPDPDEYYDKIRDDRATS